MEDLSPSDIVACTECGRTPDDPDAVDSEGWRFLPVDVEHPHPFCPECAEREFGPA